MLPSLSSLQAFEAIARRQSFALAASELHLTPSAVSHQMAKLESSLGVKLFERTAKGVQLTPTGSTYLGRVSGVLAALSQATQEVQQQDRHSLYVHASPSFASLWLMPRLSAFTREHPEIALFVSASPSHSDFQLGKVDIDIRYGVPNWQHLVIEPLPKESIMPLASESFLRQHRIRCKRDLLRVPLIESAVNLVQWCDWLGTQGIEEAPQRVELSFDRAMMSMDAAAQGLGVALESAWLAEPYLSDGRLQPVFAQRATVSLEAHFAVYPQRNAKRPAVVQFLSWLHQTHG